MDGRRGKRKLLKGSLLQDRVVILKGSWPASSNTSGHERDKPAGRPEARLHEVGSCQRYYIRAGYVEAALTSVAWPIVRLGPHLVRVRSGRSGGEADGRRGAYGMTFTGVPTGAQP